MKAHPALFEGKEGVSQKWGTVNDINDNLPSHWFGHYFGARFTILQWCARYYLEDTIFFILKIEDTILYLQDTFWNYLILVSLRYFFKVSWHVKILFQRYFFKILFIFIIYFLIRLYNYLYAIYLILKQITSKVVWVFRNAAYIWRM